VIDTGTGVERLIERATVAGLAPAASAVWGRAGTRPRTGTFGTAVLGPHPTPARPDTWFDLASLTKPLVTTTLALLAIRSDVLELSTTVGAVLDETAATPVGGLDVLSLLTHTSGLPAWLPLYCLVRGQRQRLPECLAELRPAVAPGERVIYSCIGFVTLGLILERIAGEDLQSLFQREVLKVLGLESDLGYSPNPEQRPLAGGPRSPVVETRLVAEMGHDVGWIPPLADGLPDDGNARFLDGVAGNAGLFGTAHGVWRLASEYAPGGGALLTAEEAALATALHTPGLGQGRGLGWQIASTPGCSAGPALSPAAFGHTGYTGVSAWVDPSTGGVFVLLTNRNHPWQREIDLHPLRRRFNTLASFLVK
jgi:CubicO group peptidase (beta-lactamase class C family)